MAKKRKLEDGLSNLFSAQPEHEAADPPAAGSEPGPSKRKQKADSTAAGKKALSAAAGKKPPAVQKAEKPAGSSPAAQAEAPQAVPLERKAAAAPPEPAVEPSAAAPAGKPATAVVAAAAGSPGTSQLQGETQEMTSVRDLYQPADEAAEAVEEEVLESEMERYVVFDLGGITFGVDVHSVLTIIKRLPVCPVPHSPSYLSGLINLRGQIIPVLDLGKRISLADRPESDENRIVVVEREKRLFGFSVDYVRSVEQIEVANIKEPSRMITRVKEEYLSGIAESGHGLILLLALDRLLQR